MFDQVRDFVATPRQRRGHAVALLEPPTTQQIHGMVMSDAEQPRQQSPAAGLKRGWLTPQLEKSFLDNFLGRRRVAQQSNCQRIDPSTVTLVYALERPRIPRCN